MIPCRRKNEVVTKNAERTLVPEIGYLGHLQKGNRMRLPVAILVLVVLSVPCDALTLSELADIFEAQESAIVDVVVEYEWRNEKQQPAEVIQESDDDPLTAEAEREECVFATAHPFSDRQMYSSKGDVTTKQGETFSLEIRQTYNGDVFKQLSIGGTRPCPPQGFITDRTDLLRGWTVTPMAFTILRNRKEGMLSEIRDHPEAVRLAEGTKRVRQFNTIELDFVMPQGTVHKGAVHRKYFFSVDHGYAPVRYEWIGVGSGKTDAEVDVLALKEVSPGLWFPMKGTSRHVNDNVKAVYEAKTVKVNQNLSKEYFDLEFPPDAEITDEIGYLQNADSLDSAKTAHVQDDDPRDSSYGFVILAIVPILAVAGIVLYRRLS